MYCLTVLLTSADRQQAQRWFQQTMTAGYGEVAALAMPRSRRRELPPVPTWTCLHCAFVHRPAEERMTQQQLESYARDGSLPLWFTGALAQQLPTVGRVKEVTDECYGRRLPATATCT